MKKILLVLVVIALYGCDQSSTTPEETVTAPLYSETGTVLETIDVDTYTYIRLDVQGSEVWIASNPVWVSEGDVIAFSDAILMKDFQSKVLDRTFADILFVGNLEVISGSAPDRPVTKAAVSDETDPHKGLNIDAPATTTTIAPDAITVEPLEGGKTIAEIFSEKGQIEGQEVSLRAKVTKFSPNILGKNWITLQDGTGTEPDNTLVVTTSEIVEIGDEVVVKGRVKSNVDIGAGYVYKMMLEEASFSQ